MSSAKKRGSRPQFDSNYLASLVGDTTVASPVESEAAGADFVVPPLDAPAPQAAPSVAAIPGVIVPNGPTQGFEIALELIRQYEKNPRRSANGRYTELRDSILVDGLHNRLTVTKRPHQTFFITAKGGGTRLRVLNDIVENYDALVAEYKTRSTEALDGAPAKHPLPLRVFQRISCDFAPYKDEVSLYEDHETENLHEELIWWDQAVARMEHKALIETEQYHRELSVNEYATILANSNLTSHKSKPLLLRYQWAIEKLGPIGSTRPRAITNEGVVMLRALYQDLQSIWLTANPMEQPESFQRVAAEWTKAFQAHDVERPLEALGEFWRERLIETLGLDALQSDALWTNLPQLKAKQNIRSGYPLEDWNALIAPAASAAADAASTADGLLAPPDAAHGPSGTSSETTGMSAGGHSAPRQAVDLAALRQQMQDRFESAKKELPSAVAHLVRDVLNDSHPLVATIRRARHEDAGETKALVNSLIRYLRGLLSEERPE